MNASGIGRAARSTRILQRVISSRKLTDVKRWISTTTPGTRVFCIALATLALLLYAPVAWHGYIDYDDDEYVFDNPHVAGGLTPGNVMWAFRSCYYACNWHPLTWLSHMLDCQLFGTNPGPQHLVNALLHATNSALLFLALLRMTGLPWRSACVAALFAVHPVHVESVAWIAERKDVLSTFFGLLTILAYHRYAAGKSPGRYSLVALLFALGLMSKPMLVTLPFVLLLLDYWPLGRLRAPAQIRGLIVEKIPLFVLSAGACFMTLAAQKAGAIVSLESLSIYRRLGHVAIAYAGYAGKLLWPHDLILPYPPPVQGNVLAICLSGIALLFVLIVAIEFGGRRKYLPVGLFWYLGTLVPVIGLVQVGGTLMADRYLYIPAIGIYVAIVWGAADIFPRKLNATLAGATLAVLAVLATRQLSHWKNSVTLFKHTLDVEPRNLDALNSLAWTYATSPDPALRNSAEAVRLAELGVAVTQRRRPTYLDTLAAAYAEAGDFKRAAATSREALALVDPVGQPLLVDVIRKNMERFESGKPLRGD
jgi:hypothetical protein